MLEFSVADIHEQIVILLPVGDHILFFENINALISCQGNYLYMDLNLENWPIELLDLIGLNNNPIVEAIFSMLDRIEAKNIDEQNGKACIFFTNDKVNSLAFILQEVDKMM